MKHRIENMKRKRFSKKERQRVFDKTAGRCAYCGCDITENNFVIDHVKPIGFGGSNDMGNLLPACRSCNNYKHFYELGNIEDTETWGVMRNFLCRLPAQLEKISIFKIALRYGIVKWGNWDRKFYFEKIKEEK